MHSFESLLNYQNLAIAMAFIFMLIFMYLYLKARNDGISALKASAAAGEENAVLKASLQKLSDDGNELAAKLDRGQEQILELNRSNSALEQEAEHLRTQNKELINTKDELEYENKNLSAQITQIREENAALNSLMQSKEQLFEQAEINHRVREEKLKEELKNISQTIVKTGTEDLNRFSKDSLTNVVNPLKEQLDKFREYLTLTQENEATRAGKITEGIENMNKAQIMLSSQADELTRALRSGGKSQGMWGEIQLERVLDSCGLDRRIDYSREVASENMFGDRGRPDVVLNLPEDHCIIIDAKCSLTAYTDYVNSEDRNTGEVALKAHIKSIKDHIAELDKKQYQNFRGLNSPDFVFMFVPVDGALSDALYADSSLYQYASSKGVYLVSPSSIIPALRVVSSLWMLSEQTDRMKELTRLALGVADKFRLVMDALDDIDKAQDSLVKKIAVLNDRMRYGKDNLKNRMDRFNLNAKQEFSLTEGTTISQEESL